MRIRCPIDEATEITLAQEVSVPSLPTIQQIDSAADAQRELETAQSTIRGKIATKDFDVFISYNSRDRDAVQYIVQQLKANGILPWFDIEQVRPGSPVQRILNQQIKKIRAAAVFVGKQGLGPWQNAEQEAWIARFAKRKAASVIPVILVDSPRQPKLPPLLERFAWVDFRKSDPDPIKSLIWGITGRQPGQEAFGTGNQPGRSSLGLS